MRDKDYSAVIRLNRLRLSAHDSGFLGARPELTLSSEFSFPWRDSHVSLPLVWKLFARGPQKLRLFLRKMPGMDRNSLRQLVIVVCLCLLALSTSWAGDTSLLRPPKGSKVALLVFEDLQCPDCARAAPLLHEAAKKYNIPLVQYDFPLPMHNWSFEAAVNARYFDTKSKKLGDDYRLFIFANQNYVTKQNLHDMTQKWAEQHGETLPFVVDPSGTLTAKVEADRSLGNKIPLDHTPTIYIVTDFPHGTPVTEVKDLTQLYQTLDDITRQAKASTPSTPAKTSASAKKSSKSAKSQ